MKKGLLTIIGSVVLLAFFSFSSSAAPFALIRTVKSSYENHSGISLTGITTGFKCSARSELISVTGNGGSSNVFPVSYACSVQIEYTNSRGRRDMTSPSQTGKVGGDPWIQGVSTKATVAKSIISNITTKAQSYHFTSAWDGIVQLGSHGYLNPSTTVKKTVNIEDVSQSAPIIEVHSK